MGSILKVGDRWRAQIRRAGEKSTSKTFRTKAEAIRWASAIEAEAGTPSQATLKVMIADYRALRASSGRSVVEKSNEDYMLRHLADDEVYELASTPLPDITPAKLLKWAQQRRDEGAGPYTVNMELSKLGTVLRHTKSLMGLRVLDPIEEVRPTLHYYGLIGPANERTRRPTGDELRKLYAWFAEFAPHMVDILTVSITTAMRRGEIFRVLWSDLDRARKSVLIRDRKHPRAKKGNHQEIPLLGESWDIVDRQPRGDVRIFPYVPGSISKKFKEATVALEIENLRFHDMRHEAVSGLFEAGWQIPEVAAVSGHKDWRHLRRYTQIDAAALHKKVRPLKKVDQVDQAEISDQVDQGEAA